LALEPDEQQTYLKWQTLTRRSRQMLKWAFIFLLIAIVAGLFGFSDVEATAATIAQRQFGIFLLLFLGALFIGLAIGAKLMS
jgi:uncharacterized membrane protein YtjA (UPF0391 family)